MKKYVSEFLATFTLLLAILESILLSSESGNALIVSSLVAGVVVTVLIYVFGKHSGAHMNPAVSTAMWLDNQLDTKTLLGYSAAQLAASFSAAWLIDFLHRDEFYIMGATVPTVSGTVAWMMEFGLTFLLVLVIFRFSDDRFPRMKKSGPVVIGLLIFLEIYIAGPYCGASMNPARSFGPALFDGQTLYHWLYFSAPIAGAAAGRYFDLIFRKSVPANS